MQSVKNCFPMAFAKHLMVILLAFYISPMALAAEKTVQEELLGEADLQVSQVRDKVNALTKKIDELEQAINNLDAKIATTQDVKEKTRLIELRKKQLELLGDYEKTFEDIATGNANLDIFDPDNSRSQEIDIEQELSNIFSPVVSRIKRITRDQRAIEDLRKQKEQLDSKLNETRLGIKEINELLVATESREARESLESLKSKWSAREKTFNRELQLIQINLEEKIRKVDGTVLPIASIFKEFIIVHGYNLSVSILVFIICFVVIKYTGNFIAKRVRRGQDSESRLFSRVIYICFQVLTFILSIMAFLVSLFLLDDWFILTLFLLVIFGLAFTLKDSLPSHIDEARYLLNLGSAREGQRLVYNGIPWKLSRVDLYSTLINPSLTGGVLKLPLREMVRQVGRKWSKYEAWFPSKKGDYVLLDDGVFGKSVLQTPEFIELQVYIDSIKTYPVQTYLSLNPRNLSSGFSVFVTFGFDYANQDEVTDHIPGVLYRAVSQAIKEEVFGEYLRDLTVEFEKAAASSLDVITVATFSGEAAEYYLKLERFFQRVAVQVCNENNWTIPFTQLTVTLPGQD